MMGQISQDQGQLFYSFNLEEVVPDVTFEAPLRPRPRSLAFVVP